MRLACGKGTEVCNWHVPGKNREISTPLVSHLHFGARASGKLCRPWIKPGDVVGFMGEAMFSTQNLSFNKGVNPMNSNFRRTW